MAPVVAAEAFSEMVHSAAPLKTSPCSLYIRLAGRLHLFWWPAGPWGWALAFNLVKLPYTTWFKVAMFIAFPIACFLWYQVQQTAWRGPPKLSRTKYVALNDSRVASANAT